MKIIIPLAGVGQRFINAGFKEIKPLIDIDGKPMIERICDMFPGRSEFIFICNREHETTTPLKETLSKIRPEGKIIWINQHKKGPVYSCLFSFGFVDDSEEVFVNYCDLINDWNFDDFIAKARRYNYEGALPAFRGFHPASLGDTFYAYLKVNERNEVIEIREKASFTDNRMEEFASAGGYYFSRGEIFKKYFKKIVDEKLSTSGEYYASIPYNFMVEDGLKVLVYELKKHIVLGTPEDYHTYNFWSDYFKKNLNSINHCLKLKCKCTTLVPLASKEEKLFYDHYKLPKPLTPIMKRPLLINAINCLPQTEELIVIFLKEQLKEYNFDYVLKKEYPHAKVISLKKTTEGMACTCLKAQGFFEEEKPLIISGYNLCIDYNKEELQELTDNPEIDVIIFSHKDHHYQRRNPFDHTYLKLDEQGKFVAFVSEKAPISATPFKDHAFAGTIFFRKGKLFTEAAKEMIKNEKRIHGEFYVATSVNELIKKGKNVVAFQVDKYISWARDVNLKEFEYWEDYFSSVSWHPYKKEEGIVI